LKIGIVSSFMPPHLGGLEIVAENLFHTYREAGHAVRWMASHVPAQAPRQEDGRLRVGCWNWLEGHFGVPWPVWGPGSLVPLVKLINWADVLHIHDCLYYSSALTLVLARWLNKPVLLSQHLGAITYPSAILNALASLAYKTLGRAVLQGVSHVAFCAAGAQDFCLHLSRGQLKAFSYIPVGVDTQCFHPPTHEECCQARLKLGLQQAGPVALFVGRLQEKKGALVFQEIAGRRPKIHFLMVGDGPLSPAPKENLTWLPMVPPENMPQVYHAADVVLLPSVSESLSLVTLEAMASGVPVILTRHLPIGDILEKESAGWTSERTSEEFAASMNRLLEDPTIAASMTRRARRLVELHWSNKVMAMKYLSLIQQIVKTPGHKPLSKENRSP
jgi:glycosyltransferase involved in cell wall biosynthesis